ncbi:MAG: molybdopterin-synthase adenylyltransferase MoeB [Steroidobacteraceae bacterium]
MTLTLEELARYSRHLSLGEFGHTGQEKLKAARVLVVGAGGLGSPALLYLAAAGIGTIGIVDFDRVDISNLQRQVLFNTSQVGHFKAEAASVNLQALNPLLNIVTHTQALRVDNVMEIVRDYDVVLDGTDRFTTRYLVNDACVLLKKSLVSAAIHRFEGQAFTYVPQRGPCYRCLFPQPPANGAVPNCAETGVLGVLPGVMGTLQATEVIKLITGIGEPLLGRLLTYDAIDMRFAEFNFTAREDCAVCGMQPSISAPNDMAVLCIDAPSTVQPISTVELHELISTTHTGWQLIDVRESFEFAAGHIDGAIHIPLSALLDESATFDTSVRLIFVCRSGGRSAQACTWAATRGTAAQSLQGGLLAWKKVIDPNIIVA